MTSRIVVFLFLMFSIQSFSQDKAQQAIQSFDQDLPQEKVYLQLNKNNFAAGDDIRFKAFVFDGYGQSGSSTSLFVELYDSNKKIIDKKLVPLYNSEGDGHFTLTDDLKENIYYIRAYTAWMTNFSEDFQFIKPIAVYSPNPSEKLTTNDNADWLASVYPESGTFVAGINTKLAVRLRSKGKTPRDWNGYVIDKEKPDIHITDFKGFDQNVGSFSITPQKDKHYQLIVTDSKGKKQITDLPQVAESGINLQVKSLVDKIEYQIRSNNMNNGYGYYKIIATIGNRFVYKARIKKDPNDEVFSIPTNQLINGVMQLTLFDEQENVLLQRLCFIKPQQLNISRPILQSVSLDTRPKALNSFEIKNNPNIPDYNIAIYDNNMIDNNDENILSAFWLTGDFTDKIDSPAQYFSENRNIESLDALLISEQWKRFDWKDLITGKRPMIKNKPGSYLSYNVRITSNGAPLKNTRVNILLNGDKAGSRLLAVTTDNNGEMALKNMAFYGSQKIYYQVKADNPDAIVIPKLFFISLKKELPQSDLILVKRLPNEPLTADAEKAIANSLSDKNNEKVTSIEEVRLSAKKRSPTDKLNDELSSPLFQSTSETIFDLVNDKALVSGPPDILLWLEGRVAGLQIQQDGADLEAFIRNKKVDVYLDEVKTDPEIIRGFNISNVAMIKVVRDDFFGGFGNSNGAILIYTKNGNSVPEEVSKSMTGLNSFTINGYSKPEAYKNTRNDNRSLLYWNPNLNTSSDQAEKIEFYNNDSAKQFRVMVISFDNANQLPFFYDDKLP